MNDTKAPKIYEERVLEKKIFSCSEITTRELCETDLKVTNCTFVYLNREDNNTTFQLVERDDGKGMNVFMHEVSVIPSHFIYLNPVKLPKWLKFLIDRFYPKESD